MFIDKRKEKRFLWPGAIYYYFGEKTDRNSGICVNASNSGLCFYSHQYFIEEQELDFDELFPWDGPKSGTVRWCIRINDQLYKVGVSLQ